jgi:hypothetical protein
MTANSVCHTYSTGPPRGIDGMARQVKALMNSSTDNVSGRIIASTVQTQAIAHFHVHKTYQHKFSIQACRVLFWSMSLFCWHEVFMLSVQKRIDCIKHNDETESRKRGRILKHHEHTEAHISNSKVSML